MNKLYIYLTIISSLLLTGCETFKVTKTQIVKVPIITKCEPTTTVTEITEYPFDKANKEMSLYEKNQLLAAENSLVKGQNIELKAALKECTK